MSVDEQLINLKKLRLIIKDEAYAKRILNDISYYRLIKAYGLGLKSKNSLFHEGTTFEEIVNLYMFNVKFRQLIFPKVEQVEINFRCRLANYFSCKYGVFAYKDFSLFQCRSFYNDATRVIKDAKRRNKNSPIVKNFTNNYVEKELPFYALVEILSFGNLSKFYKNMLNKDKKSIATQYNIGYTYLESWIEHISFVRNVCAHYGRIYNINLSKPPVLYKQYTSRKIDNTKIFATLLVLKHLLPNDNNWLFFIDTIAELLEKYTDVKKELMGFPNDWKTVLHHY